MTSEIDRVLAPLASQDSFLARALQVMVERIANTEIAGRMSEVQLYVSDYRGAPPELQRGRYFTASCAALRDSQAIIVNEAFLLESESAIRSFNLAGELLATPYLRSDEDLLALIERTQRDPHRYVERLRSLSRLPGCDDERTIEQFALLLAFLVGHELGHLDQGHEQRSFGAFVDANAPLEVQLGNAVVKLGRHAREFARLGFGLPGFEAAVDEASEVGSNEKQWREQLREISINHTRWFEDESAADHHGATLVQQALAQLDVSTADLALAELTNALFATALYHWQRDLGLFLQKLGLRRLGNAQQLAFAMVQQRERYIHAATLFGDVHRFTLLRAILAINQLLHARGVITHPLVEPLSRAPMPEDRGPMDPQLAAQCSQREMLLRIHVDTAVKIAHVGSMTGWLLDTDRLRGSSQLLFMNFESIAHSTQRLQRMM